MFDPTVLDWPIQLVSKRLLQCACPAFFDFDWVSVIGHSQPKFSGLHDLSLAICAEAKVRGKAPILVLTINEEVHYDERETDDHYVGVVSIRPFLQSVRDKDRSAPFFMNVARRAVRAQNTQIKTAQLIAVLDDLLRQDGGNFGETLSQAGPETVVTLLRMAGKAVDGPARNRDFKKLGEIFGSDSSGLISDLTTLVRRRASVEEFQKHLVELDWNEESWQKFFERNPWFLGHASDLIFTHLLQAKAVVRPADYTRKGERQADFLMRTTGSNAFLRLVEIKKPQSALASRDYRAGIPTWTDDLVGGINQTIAYCHNLEGLETGPKYIPGVIPTTIPGILIIGTKESISENEEWLAAFENFRGHLHGIRILCFDEVLERGRQMIRDQEDCVTAMLESEYLD